MYGKKLIRKIGSLVVIATLIASAFFVVLQNESGIEVKAVLSNISNNVPIITEILYHPDLGYPECVELYNPTGEAINTTGWYITDNESQQFGNLPSSIPAYSYVCVTHSGPLLNNDGDSVYLYNNTNSIVAVATYTSDVSEKNHSIELNETGGWQENLNGSTCGEVNSFINPPVTTYNIEGKKIIDDKYVNVTITLNATDETGVRATFYKINDGVWKTYNGSFKLNEPGTYKIYYYSIDFWNKSEEQKNFSFQICNLSVLTVTPTTANWDETKTIEVNNAQGNVSLYNPDGTLVKGPALPPYVRWSNVHFDKSGSWWVVDTKGNAKAIDVKPVSLDVNATPDKMNFTKTGQSGCYVNIEGTVKMNGAAATTAIVKIHYPDGSTATTNVANDSTFSFLDVNVGLKGVGEYNITAYIGNEANPNAFGYDIFKVNMVEPNITLIKVDAVGGFPKGKASFEVTYPEDGAALLVNNAYYPHMKYNVSIYKGNELYAWKNTSDGSHGGNITFEVSGKLLNLTSAMWETGDYKLKVNVDVTGDGIWEYSGEKDYSIPSPPAVNVDIITPSDKKLNVLAPDQNAQNITIQIFGNNMKTYGNKTNLKIGANNENVTDRIKVEGDVLYSPPAKAYYYLGNGTWNITVFPTKGNGKIYVNVTWPDKGTANEVIDVVNGGYTTVAPDKIRVDTPKTVEVQVKDKTQQIPFYNANVTIVYETGLYGIGNTIASSQHATGEGKYVFNNFTSSQAGVNIIVIASFDYDGMKYAYARIESQAAHDLKATIAPSTVLAGEMTTFKVNITRDNASYSDTFEFYVLNETQLQKLHDGKLDLGSLTPITPTKVSKGNYTYTDYVTKDGTYYLYIKTTDSKHDNLKNESSFVVSKASVSTSPTALVKNVDKNMTITFTVTWNGKPLNGTLIIKGIQQTGSFEAFVQNATYSLTITNGKGNITGVDATAVGNITFEFKPEKSGSQLADADGVLKVEPPQIDIVEPATKIAFVGEENLIVIKVTHRVTQAGCAGLNVSIKTPGNNAVLVGKTDADGKLMFGVMPLQTGEIEIYIENELVKTIPVKLGLKIHAQTEVEKGKEFSIFVTTITGKAIEGATVKVNGTTIGTTDSNGEIKYKPTTKGTITITAEKDGYYTATKSITVTKSPGKTPGFEFIGLAIGLLAAILIARRRK